MLQLDPGNVELKRTLAQDYVRAKQYDSALVVYGELREVQPDNIDYRSEMASVYLMKKEYAEAANLFEIVLAQDSVSLESKLRIGEVYFGQLESDSALVPVARSIFERIRDAHPDDRNNFV